MNLEQWMWDANKEVLEVCCLFLAQDPKTAGFGEEFAGGYLRAMDEGRLATEEFWNLYLHVRESGLNALDATRWVIVCGADYLPGPNLKGGAE